MKIEIDLKDILGDEYGPSENLAESIRRQIIEKLTATLREGIEKKINGEISLLIRDQIKGVVATQMPSLVEDLLSAEYHQVNQWGDVQKETTTVRKELVRAIQNEMQYKPQRYDSDKNAFTKAVDQAALERVNAFKKDFDAQVQELFHKEVFDYAVKKMGDKLGVKV